MLARHGGHELVCVHSADFDIPGPVMPDDVSHLPDFLPKLWAWSPEFHAIVGGRFASIDLDAVVLGDLGRLLADGFRIWDYASGEPYNTSLFALGQGQHHEVWNRLSDSALTKAKQTTARWTGDQSWVAHVLGTGHPTFGERDGVICYRPKSHRENCPDGTLAAFFCGPYDPRSEARCSSWVNEAWR